MSIGSLVSSQPQTSVSPAVLLGTGGSTASGFALPGAAGVSGNLGANLATGSSGGLSAPLSTLLLQIQQGANALQGGATPATAASGSSTGTPGSVRHHRHDRSGTDASAGATSASSSDTVINGTGQTADAAASGTSASTPDGSGGLLLGDMMQAMQTYASIGGMLLA